MFLFWPLLQKTQAYLTPEQIDFLADVFLFSAQAHAFQTRRTGEPYISHPVAVACILADLRMDVDVLAATLMHDVVEDTSIDLPEIEDRFGPVVAQLVDGVTKLKSLTDQPKSMLQADSFRKMLMASTHDVRVLIMKLADRLHNVQSLSALRPDKRRRIARETMDIYVPIANRLGMHAFKNQLEEYAFAGLYPLRYHVLRKTVDTAIGHRKRIVEKILDLLRQDLQTQGIPPEHIQGREKRLYSIFRKMRYKELSLSEIMDVYAFRVIADSIPDCYRILGCVHHIFKPVPGRFKDYIAIPKANGYQSLHTTLFGPHGVPIEIQIRTQDMHDVAENGIAAHWLYKDQQEKTFQTEQKTQNWFQKLQDIQARSGNSMEFLEHMKIDLFPDEVYVFTPKGDIMELPTGATALDFAYAVHTDIGHQAKSIKVNRKEVPLNHPLHSGDQVEILRDPETHPIPAWLNFVVTGKAKAAIRFHLKMQEDEKSVELGRKLLNYALAELGLQLDQVPLTSLLQVMNHSQPRQLFYAIGVGECTSADIAIKLKTLNEHTPQLFENSPTGLPSALLIHSPHDSGFHFCDQCSPLPGDRIAGVLCKGKHAEVHRTECALLHRKLADDSDAQLLTLRFADPVQGQWPCNILITSLNKPGVLAMIASALSSLHVNIQDMSFEEIEKSHAKMRMTLEVSHRHHLAQVLRRLRHIPEVLKVQLLRHEEKH